MKKPVLHSLFLLFILANLLGFTSCTKEVNLPTPHLGENYFPLQKGSWISYKVDSITWNDFFTPTQIDTFSFLIKLKIDTQFIDNEGNETYYWRKYYKTDSTAWELIKNYTITKKPERVETYEENLRYVKLAFPVKNTTTWDLNAFNTLKATSSYYDEYDVPKTINLIPYDSCVVVIHHDQESLINKSYHQEIYGKNIGLLYKNVVEVDKEVSGEWKRGYFYTYTIINKGIEN